MKRFSLAVKAAFLIIMLFPLQLFAQSIPVGFPVIEDYYRNAQLLGQIDSSISFTSRPFVPKALLKVDNSFDPDTSLENNRWTKFDGIFKRKKGKLFVQILPITILQQFNSNHAAGINDGIMIPAKGYQSLVSAGLFLKYGPLSIQLRPEFIYAKNSSEKNKVDSSAFNSSQIDQWYADFITGIELPVRFGEKPYQKVSWGQSSIRLTFGAISFGLSNENLWWGPGIYNSLMMSNNAPGFKHLTLNTVKPIRTPIGSFEGQIIAGRLEGSGFSPSKPNDWRYLNGIVLSYQPRWVPGLFLGVTRTFQAYHKDMWNSIQSYLPIFDLLTKQSGGGDYQNTINQDQIASFFMRWLWTKGQGEIYFEFGREDHAWNIRDFVMEPTSNAAYLIGLRKIIPLRKDKKEYIQVNMEVTQLEMDNITFNRYGGSWYTNAGLINGYTNQGQVLGAGIGPGSNLQTISISWNKKLKTIGLQFERYVHNDDFFHAYINNAFSFNNIRYNITNWVDFNTAIFSEWNYKNLIFTVKLESIRSKNYKWYYTPIQSTPPVYWDGSNDVLNFHGQLGITYRF